MERYLPTSFLRNSISKGFFLFLCFIALTSAKVFAQAAVQTDQSDYPPGSTVYITGSGFAAGEQVTLQVLHTDTTSATDDATSQAHQPWMVTADGSGNISSTWTVPLDEDEAGATLQLTAIGQTSGLTARAIFTDAPPPPPTISYTPASNTYTVGIAITSWTPTLGGGTIQHNGITISPALPAGLSIDANTGTISGTPTIAAVNPAGGYVVSAKNSGGTGTFTINITVNNPPPPTIAYSPTSNTFTVGSAISSWTPTLGGGAVQNNGITINPALPAGLSIDANTGTISGTPTVAAVNPAGGYIVSAKNSGGTGTATINITVNPAKPIITYTSPNTYVAGTAITPLNPTNTGGAVQTGGYSVSPALPAGLSIDANTGVISGTPTTVTAQATYTVTATNVTGSATFGVVITVNPGKPAITYTSPNVFIAGTAITPLSPTNSGGAVQSGGYSVSPALPAGLSIDANTGVISGTPTTVTAQATYTVTATNVSGSGTFGVVITVNPPAPNITYPTPDTYTYGAAITALTPTNTGGAVPNGGYSVSPALPAGLSLNANTGAITGTPTAATATAIYTVKATNVTGSSSFAITITVNQRPLTVTAKGNNRPYDGTTTATVSLSDNALPGDKVTESYTTANFVSKDVAQNIQINVSGIAISGGADAGNYTLVNTTATTSANISAIPLTVTATGPTKVYGTALTAGTSSTNFTYTGTVNGETVTSVTLTPNAAGLSPTTAAGATYTVTPSAPTGAGGFLATNYTITFNTYTGTVSQAPLTVTANDATKTYGQTYTVVTGSTAFTSSALQNSETIGSVTITYGSGGAATDPVGTYNNQVTPSAATGGTFNPANYSITYVSGKLTVSQADLTITANSQGKTYGSAQDLGTTAFSTSTLYNSDQVSGVTLTSSGSAATATVGVYDIVPSAATGTGLSNYNISYVNGHDTVKVAPVTVTADNHSKTYGSAQDLGTTAFTTSTLYNGDKVNSVTLTSPGSAGTATVGTYDITPSAASGTGLSNYNITYAIGHDTVKVAPLTVTANNQSKIYGSAQDLGTTAFTTSALYNGDKVNNVTLTSSGSAASATVGTYDIMPSAASGTGLSNYSITYAIGHDTVKVAPLTITANNQSKTYGSVQDLGITAFTTSTLYNGDKVNSVTLTSAGSAGTATVGTYDISPSAASGTGLSNYSITYNIGHDTVKVAPLTITASNQSKVYGSVQNLGSTDFTTSTLYNGDKVNSVTLTSAGSAATATVGTYDITPSAASGTGLSNYSITYAIGHDTVKVAPLTVTASNQSKIYGSAQDLGTTAFTTSTLYNGDKVNSVTLISPGSAGTATVGTYDIIPSAALGTGLSNYSITYAIGHDTVKVAPLTVTANNQSKIYGSVQTLGTTAFTTSTLYNGDKVNSVTLTSAGSAGTATVGVYDITPSAAVGTGLTNYSITYAVGHDTVKVAPLTVTASNQSKIYGSDQDLGSTAFTTSTMYNGDKVNTLTLTSAGSAATAIVGTYDITPSAAVGTGLSNYTITYAIGHDTAKVAPLTVTANNQSKIYGSTQTLGTTAFTTSTLYNGDKVNNVTLTSTGSAGTTTVGVYDIVPSAALGTGLTNYSITYVNGHDTVKVAPLTIAASNQTKVYGTTQNLGTTAFTTSTMYNSDKVTGVTLTSLGSPMTAIVGTYDIVPSAAVGNGLTNYSITYINGHDTVKVAPLTITASNQSKVYGVTQTLGSTAFTTTTMYNSDKVTGVTLTSAGSVSTASVAGSPYDIVPSAAVGTGLTNYTITYVNGHDTVNTAPLTITANNVTKTYGQALTGGSGSTAFTSAGLQNSETIGSVTITYGTGSAATDPVSGSPYTGQVVPSAATGGTFTTSNYSITYNPGDIIIKQDSVCGVYNGVTFANTDVSSNGTVLSTTTVTLSLVINTTGGADARTATVKFTTDNNGGPYTTTLAGGTATQATYTASMPVNIGTALSKTTLVTWTIGGNFANSTTCQDINTEVTVSTRTADFVTGGGFVVLNASSGSYAGDQGSKANFGFNVKWNKSLTNIQGGGFNGIVRHGNLIYQIKAAKVATLAVTQATNSTPGAATFTSGNGTINVMNAQTGALISTVGNLNLTVQMTDLCDPGPGNNTSGDMIGITLKDNKGNLMFSNNWVSNATQQQGLGGGNLQVHGDAGTPSAPTCSSSAVKTAMVQTPGIYNFKSEPPPLSATVYPNPSITNFNLQLKGGTDDRLEITVTDILGHVIEVHRAEPGAALTVGNNLRTGMYLIQVRQGQTYKFYRVFKQ